MAKQLAIRMEKMYDFPDGEAEKYAVLAFFKEQEKVKNNLLNAAVVDTMQQPVQHLSLSEKIASGIVSDAAQPMPTVANTNITENINRQNTRNNNTYVTMASERKVVPQSFTLTDLLLCVVAFLLFLILILR